MDTDNFVTNSEELLQLIKNDVYRLFYEGQLNPENIISEISDSIKHLILLKECNDTEK